MSEKYTFHCKGKDCTKTNYDTNLMYIGDGDLLCSECQKVVYGDKLQELLDDPNLTKCGWGSRQADINDGILTQEQSDEMYKK